MQVILLFQFFVMGLGWGGFWYLANLGQAAILVVLALALTWFRIHRGRAWKEAALDSALKERQAEAANAELAAAMQRIGELSMENELLRARIGRPGPLARGRSR